MSVSVLPGKKTLENPESIEIGEDVHNAETRLRFTSLSLKVNARKGTDRIWMCAKMINLHKH